MPLYPLFMGQYYLDKNMGREVSLAEATTILENCRDAGLVTQPATSQNPSGMCNCCGDCCGVLNALSKHPKPDAALRLPPANTAEQMFLMAQKRGIL